MSRELRIVTVVFSVVLAVVLAAVLPARPALAEAASDPKPAATAEVFFEVEASVRQRTLSADVLAGGRLLMNVTRAEDGGVTLSLVEPIEHPYKLYRFDPWGPLGEEAKEASVITLAAPSWAAVEAARAAAAARAAERYRGWPAAGGQAFDGGFAFLVIGPPAGRFEVELGGRGRPRRIENRLTDRWLTGELDPLLKRWAGAAAGSPGTPEMPLGYWFWNDGESEPFAWQPHTYHALAAALALLDRPALPDRSPAARPPQPGERYRLEQRGLVAGAWKVLATLAPRIRERLPAAGTAGRPAAAGPVADDRLAAGFTVTLPPASSAPPDSAPGALLLAGEGGPREVEIGGDRLTLSYQRRLLWTPDGPLADRLTVTVAGRRQRVTVTVGWGEAGGVGAGGVAGGGAARD